ncbi:MAG: hypothetical protein AAF492_08730, partial [Verrucomicrobiota bacterium]
MQRVSEKWKGIDLMPGLKIIGSFQDSFVDRFKGFDANEAGNALSDICGQSLPKNLLGRMIEMDSIVGICPQVVARKRNPVRTIVHDVGLSCA